MSENVVFFFKWQISHFKMKVFNASNASYGFFHSFLGKVAFLRDTFPP